MKNLLKSLASFQQEVPVIHKGTQGYGYSYADLPTILEVINPLLKKHGLGFYQAVDGEMLTTTVFHIDSGEMTSAEAQIPQGVELKGMNAFQVLGSAITYMRRYQLSAMLGLVTDVDNDAAGQQISTQKKKESEVTWLNPGTKAWDRAELRVAEVGFDQFMKDLKNKSWAVSKENQEKLKALSV